MPARNVYTCTYVYAYRSFFDPFFFVSSKMRQRFFPPSKLSFLPPFLLSFPRSRKFYSPLAPEIVSVRTALNERRLFIELCPFRSDACKHGWNEWKQKARESRDSTRSRISLPLSLSLRHACASDCGIRRGDGARYCLCLRSKLQ